MNRMLKVCLVLLAGVVVSGVLAYAVHRNILGPAKAREDAFTAIDLGQLSPDPNGVVTLPPALASASIDGKAYVTHSAEDRVTWIFFLKERGWGKKVSGYLFCNNPSKAAAKGVIEINYPKTGSTIDVKVVRVDSAASFEVTSEGGGTAR